MKSYQIIIFIGSIIGLSGGLGILGFVLLLAGGIVALVESRKENTRVNVGALYRP